MTLALSFPTQHLLPWTEAVTFVSVRNSGNVSVSVGDAARYPITMKEVAASGGVYRGDDVVWTLSDTAIESAGWKVGDRIEVDGVAYTVLSAAHSPFLQFVKFVTRNLVLAADLRDTCSVLRPANTQDAALFRVPGLTVVPGYESIPCRLQEQNLTADDTFDAAGETREFTLFVGTRLFLRHQDVIQIGATRYDVIGAGSWDRIDQLGEVRVRRIEA